MGQFAGLEYDGRGWVLLTDLDDDAPARRWTNRDAALQELAEEGWSIAESYPHKLWTGKQQWQVFYGHTLVRVVH